MADLHNPVTICGKGPDGTSVAVAVDASGNLSGGGGGGGGGSSDTTEAPQLLVKSAVQNLDLDLGTPADGAAATDVAAVGVIPLIRRSLQRWTYALTVMVLAYLPISVSSMPTPTMLPASRSI